MTQQAKQYDGKLLIVYRGQGLSKIDFDKLMKTKDALMSFNNFLSTSVDRNISLSYAKKVRSKTDTVGVLFRMIIPPCILSTPFAFIHEYSHYKTEEEILFSMHAVFRVNKITKIDTDDSLYQVSHKQSLCLSRLLNGTINLTKSKCSIFLRRCDLIRP